MNVRHSAAPLGTEIRGLDLAQPLDDATFRAIEELFHDRGVIVFRDQRLSEEQHIDFSRRFGELEIHVAKQYVKASHPEILVLSNIIENGRHLGLHDAGQYWHSDFSFVANPSRCSLLFALEVPVQDGRVLGQTLFASAVHALDTLPNCLKERLEGKRAVHRYIDRYRKLQDEIGREPLTEEQLRRVPDVCHPVIRTHARTGRRVLFVNEGFTVFIEGMTATDSSALLQELFTHIARQEMIYAHQWREGDLLMWDNCLVQHRAVRNYELPLRRLMHRTTVAGP